MPERPQNFDEVGDDDNVVAIGFLDDHRMHGISTGVLRNSQDSILLAVALPEFFAGSPIMDSSGRAIGVATKETKAVPIKYAMALYERCPNHNSDDANPAIAHAIACYERSHQVSLHHAIRAVADEDGS